MISCAISPLIANWLDVVIGNNKNQWHSERLIVLFFSALSGAVIWDKICRMYKKAIYIKKVLILRIQVHKNNLYGQCHR